MNSFTQQDTCPPYQDWSKPKHISPISLLEQRTFCSRKWLCSLPPWRNSSHVKKRNCLQSQKLSCKHESKKRHSIEKRGLILPTVNAKRASLVMSQCQGKTEDLRRLREDMPGHQKCPSSFGAPKASDTSYSASSWKTCRERGETVVLRDKGYLLKGTFRQQDWEKDVSALNVLLPDWLSTENLSSASRRSYPQWQHRHSSILQLWPWCSQHHQVWSHLLREPLQPRNLTLNPIIPTHNQQMKSNKTLLPPLHQPRWQYLVFEGGLHGELQAVRDAFPVLPDIIHQETAQGSHAVNHGEPEERHADLNLCCRGTGRC